MKLPAIQFYPGDWKRDIGVQSLSLHDRMVWFELLMLMHDSEKRGYLLLNGKPMSSASIARNIGISVEDFDVSMRNIVEAGVSSIDDNGVLFSRRIVRDEHIRQVRREAGKKGGNPALTRKVLDNQNSSKTKNESKQPVKQTPTPSSSSSSSSERHTAHYVRSSAPPDRGSGQDDSKDGRVGDTQAKTKSVSGKSAAIPAASSKKAKSTPPNKSRRVDPRFTAFKSELEQFWDANHVSGSKMPWLPRDCVGLIALLDAEPDMDVGLFSQLLRNRAASSAINFSALIYAWIRDVRQYEDGPLDEYKKPLIPNRVL